MSCPEEDILLYAQAFYGRFGYDALSLAMERSADLAACGDHEGVEVWRHVAREIERLIAVSGERDDDRIVA